MNGLEDLSEGEIAMSIKAGAIVRSEDDNDTDPERTDAMENVSLKVPKELSTTAKRESELRQLKMEQEKLRRDMEYLQISAADHLRPSSSRLDASKVSSVDRNIRDKRWLNAALDWLHAGPQVSEMSSEEWMELTRSFGLTRKREKSDRPKGFSFNEKPSLSANEANKRMSTL